MRSGVTRGEAGSEDEAARNSSRAERFSLRAELPRAPLANWRSFPRCGSCYLFLRLSLLSSRLEWPAPMTAPAAAFPATPPITAPPAAPLALGCSYCCCLGCVCCWVWVAAGGGCGGGVCAGVVCAKAPPADAPATRSDMTLTECFIIAYFRPQFGSACRSAVRHFLLLVMV